MGKTSQFVNDIFLAESRKMAVYGTTIPYHDKSGTGSLFLVICNRMIIKNIICSKSQFLEMFDHKN